ncbi:ABC transporter substrate-binding protein [Trichlorobacter lovleyi]|uniref:ABC transporter substrate-binding protein n=1 Tax=Trichlorobacter lovleyi TaxID=313985 RepID=UPI002240497B|nr:ABC transporter substrate-binding protein [Trichlorobacter lovleyi]QOX80368.1 ABC transporter substrate-binding protein [Trichlorobacter lovleyi]
MRVKHLFGLLLVIALSALTLAACKPAGKEGTQAKPAAQAKGPLKIAYSDWPGWVAWEIGIQKGFFKEAGVDAQFQWFEYAPSMDAFVAGKVDAVAMSNGDTLVNGAKGKKGTMILINDYSNGNDMIIARPGIKSIKDLKGKKVALEVGLLEHLMLNHALKQNGMKPEDVTLINTPTHQTAQTLASGDVDAIAAWQPNSGQALKAVNGAKAIYTSANAPGLIYDALVVDPQSLSDRKEDWQKVVKVWYRIIDYMKNPANEKEVLQIMSARVNVPAAEYATYMKGTRFLSLAEAQEAFKQSASLTSLYGSSKNADDFNIANKVYDKPQNPADYIDASLVANLK